MGAAGRDGVCGGGRVAFCWAGGGGRDGFCCAGAGGSGAGAVVRWTGAASASVGVEAVGDVDGRAIGAPIGERRGALCVRTAGGSPPDRCTGAPSPARAGPWGAVRFFWAIGVGWGACSAGDAGVAGVGAATGGAGCTGAIGVGRAAGAGVFRRAGIG